MLVLGMEIVDEDAYSYENINTNINAKILNHSQTNIDIKIIKLLLLI